MSHDPPVSARSNWDHGFDPARFVGENADAFLEEFGWDRLDETAFPVYTNRVPLARWLGFERIRVAARLSRTLGAISSAVDFGSGLGVSLPDLSDRSQQVWAVDRDPDVTRFALARMQLPNVNVVESIQEVPEGFDLLLALDVFEHVPDLRQLVDELADVTRTNGHWIISGPTENALYHLMRRFSRTTGEAHVRGIDRVLEIVSTRMAQVQSVRRPINTALSASLFEIALFCKT